ncbi:Trm112 family protein [Melaminivora jejuensis]|uniref:Trm112 family protein n=1 Tax=Melaminivora jejuensis TaxID=1267217 RepID=UPI002D7E6EDD|nr:Trm112 family protein [Melaminivora jejuensis]
MTEGVQTTRLARLARILPLLACPACRAPLRQGRPHILECTSCEASYPVRDGVPILLPAAMQEPGVGSADTDDPVSRHPYSPRRWTSLPGTAMAGCSIWVQEASCTVRTMSCRWISSATP